MTIKQWYNKIQERFHGNKTQAGFTLVEVLVALTLFVFVVLAAISSLYSVNDAYRKVTAMRSVLDNLSFAMESMSRTVRTSRHIICNGTLNSSGTRNCSFPNNPASRLSMYSLVHNYEIEYRLNATTQQLEKRMKEGGTWSDWISITAPEIKIHSFSVFVQGSDTNENLQPGVILLVRGIAAAYTGETTPFALHTFISQRSGK